MEKPEWLPEPLDYKTEWEFLEEMAYRIFCADFKEKPVLLYKDKPVTLNLDINYSEQKPREKSFYHLIKKTENRMSRRNINDPLRAVRISWIRPLIENCSNKEVLCWDFWESIGLVRTYLWLVNYSFVVILQEEPTEYVFISVYFVDRPERLRKKFENRIK